MSKASLEIWVLPKHPVWSGHFWPAEQRGFVMLSCGPVPRMEPHLGHPGFLLSLVHERGQGPKGAATLWALGGSGVFTGW